MVKQRRVWTAEKKAAVLDYLKTHSNKETMQHFKVSSGQLHVWKTGRTYYRGKNKSNGAANGVLALEQKDALMHLERWRAAYLASIKNETPSAAELLRALMAKK